MSSVTLESLLHELRRRWHDAGVATLPPSSSDDISAFETTFNVQMPLDFRRYCESVGGMPLGVTDEWAWRFWPLKEIVPYTHSPDYFVFMDFLIQSEFYAIRLADAVQPVVVIPNPERHIVVAPTFTEFLTLYLRDRTRLLRRDL